MCDVKQSIIWCIGELGVYSINNILCGTEYLECITKTK